MVRVTRFTFSIGSDLTGVDTKFHVKPLPHARIPIIKLTLEPSPQVPNGLACDIGFENRLALENTRLLHTYASIDPDRVRTMVLFRQSCSGYWCEMPLTLAPSKNLE